MIANACKRDCGGLYMRKHSKSLALFGGPRAAGRKVSSEISASVFALARRGQQNLRCSRKGNHAEVPVALSKFRIDVDGGLLGAYRTGGPNAGHESKLADETICVQLCSR